MTSLSDTLTVGLILVLLFGAVVLYLYTRLQQAEHKISLLENILLDLKISTEIHSYSELPASEHDTDLKGSTESTPEPYVPFTEENEVSTLTEDTPSTEIHSADVSDHEVEQYKSVVAEAIKDDHVAETVSESNQANYESMTLKELQGLAKSRGIVGTNTMKKNIIIEALKTSDKSHANSVLESGFTGTSSSFLETSSAFPANESS